MRVRPRPWMTRTPASSRIVSTSGTTPTAAIFSPVVTITMSAFDLNKSIGRLANSRSHRPLINTSPRYGSAPVESKMLTSRNRILESSGVPNMEYSVGCKLSSNLTASIVSMFRGRPLWVERAASVVVGQGTAGSSRAGDMLRVRLL